MYRFRSDLNYRVRLLKAGALACVAGLHLAVIAAIVAGPASSARPAAGMPEQVSIVQLLPAPVEVPPVDKQPVAKGVLEPEDVATTPQPEQESTIEPTPDSEAEPETDIKPEPIKPEPKPIAEPEPDPKPVSRPEPKPKPVHESKPKPTHKPKKVVLSRKSTVQRQQPVRKATPASKASAVASMDKTTSTVSAAQSRSTATPQALVAAPTKPHWISRVAYQGQPPSPRYPRAALRHKQTGEVVVRVLISPQGRVINAKVHKSSGHELLDDAALDAVRDTRFKPYTENGVAYSARADVPIAFVL